MIWTRRHLAMAGDIYRSQLKEEAMAGDIYRSQLKEEEGYQLVEARDATRNPTSLRALPPSSLPTQRHSKEVSSPVSGAGVEKPCLRIRAGKNLTTESEMQDQR